MEKSERDVDALMTLTARMAIGSDSDRHLTHRRGVDGRGGKSMEMANE
ncbi:unnamed protein product [Strongylus vulgaris]|uniref:Uncharacterized protein n=1 Tax=Strongylus vulgaris TaxID=40348 RepID=A0A3P7LYZ0_STRVU|nr:unnamed protein product [Strongylus vulgaris]